jgi:hypothetical protein
LHVLSGQFFVLQTRILWFGDPKIEKTIISVRKDSQGPAVVDDVVVYLVQVVVLVLEPFLDELVGPDGDSGLLRESTNAANETEGYTLPVAQWFGTDKALS